MPQAVAVVLGNIALGLTAGASLATSAAAFSFATALGSALGSVALVAGPSLIIRAFSGRGAGGSSAPNSPEVRGNSRQAIPSQRVIYGYVRVGGAVFFLDDSKPPYLYLGLMLSKRRITNVFQTYVGTNPVEFDTVAENTISSTVTAPYRSGGGTVRLFQCFRDGDPDQVMDAILAADFPNLDAEFRQRGIATMMMKFRFGPNAEEHQAIWGNVQIPNVLFDVAGAPVYDPRDPTQDMDDEDTWKFSNNAALVQADYLRQPYGGRQPTSKMRWDEIALAADYDDSLVGIADGTLQRRYTIDGVITLNQIPVDVMGAMLQANRGFVVQHNGRMWVTSSRPQDPVMTIHDNMLVGKIDFRGSAPKKSLVNKVRTRFVAPDREYQIVDGPVLESTELETEDGEVLEAPISLSFTREHQRAQRIAYAYRQDSRLGKSISCQVSLDALGLRAGLVVKFWSVLFPMMNGIYFIEETLFAEDFSSIQLVLNEYDKDIDASWLPSMEQEFVLEDLDVS